MNSEIAVKKKEPEGLEGQNKVEPRCPEDHHRYETFTVEEMMKQSKYCDVFFYFVCGNLTLDMCAKLQWT